MTLTWGKDWLADADARSNLATALWFFFLLMACVSIFVFPSFSLRGADESREAGIAREMADSGDFIVPRLNGKPFLEKPPLEYASAAESIKLLGPTLQAVRLPSELFGLVAIAAVFATTWSLAQSVRAAVLSAIVLGTSVHFQQTVHLCLTNAPLMATTAIAMLAFERALTTSRPILWASLFYAALAFGFLSKNFFGVAVPAVAVAAYVLLARDRRVVDRIVLSPALVLFAIVLPWLGLLYSAGQRETPARGGAFLYEVLISNNFGRFFSGYGGHSSVHWYEVIGFLAAALAPWTPVAAIAVADSLRKVFESSPVTRYRACLLTAWMLAPPILVAASQSKRQDYFVCMIAPFAVATGTWWLEVIRDPTRRIERAVLVVSALAAAAGPIAISVEDFLLRRTFSWIALFAAGVGIAMLAMTIRWARHSRLTRLAMATAFGAIAFTVGSLDPVIVHARDFESSGTFGAELAAARPVGKIGALGFGEREFGLTYFYLGHEVTDLSSLSLPERARFLSDSRCAGILLAQRGPQGEPASPTQLVAQYLGPATPGVRIRVDGIVGGRRILFVTR
jgi:4-amino-4-deoxy-L-arabinose transferase-like glycosyltransferase